MSLMPSESYGFPDHFSRCITRARVLNEIKALKTEPRRPRLSAPATVPVPAPVESLPEPPAPLPVAPTPRNGTSRPISTNGNGRARIGKPYGPVRVPQRQHVDLAAPEIKSEERKPRPVVVKKKSPNGHRPRAASHARRGRDGHMLRFVFVELAIIGILIPSAMLSLSQHLSDSTLIFLINMVAIIAAAALVIVPVIFFATAPDVWRDPD